MPAMPTPPHVRTYAVGATVIAELHGSVDLLTAPAVTQHLDAVTARPQPRVVLDLRSVTFIDCTGLGVLCRTLRRAVAQGGDVSLLVDDPRILRTLRITGLTRLFEVYDRPPFAVTAWDAA